MQLSIITWNTGKYRQISSLLEGTVSCVQHNIDLIEPQSNDMFAVSRTKVLQAFALVWWPVLVDDSGIYFAAYPDFPGVFSKYMFQSLGIEGLRNLFINQLNTKAYFQCVLSYMDASLSEPKQFVWRVEWTIDFSFLDQVTFDTHLPYDAIFRAEGMEVVAQLAMPIFEQIHHRAQATELCKEWLQKRM